MRERAKELKAEAQKEKGESAVLAKIAEMQGTDRAMAERLHAIIKASAPALSPKTWYGMPAYADKDGKVVRLYEEILQLDPQNRLLPVDYGDVCLNYDKAWFAENDLAPPTDLPDLTQPDYEALTVVESPATSSPGLAFLLQLFPPPGEIDRVAGHQQAAAVGAQGAVLLAEPDHGVVEAAGQLEGRELRACGGLLDDAALPVDREALD